MGKRRTIKNRWEQGKSFVFFMANVQKIKGVVVLDDDGDVDDNASDVLMMMMLNDEHRETHTRRDKETNETMI